MQNTYLLNDGFLTLCVFLTLLLPLASSLLSFVTSDRYSWLTILNAPLLLLLATIFSAIVVLNGWNNTPGILEIPWVQLSESRISANLYLSNTAALMMTVVSLISFLVHLYSVGYMAGDDNPRKYFGMLGLFTFAMQGIVLSDNLLVLFIFWELVGFSSYLLIGHWNENEKPGSAASKAFLFNRIGDAAFLVGLMILWSQTGSFEISALLQQSFQWQTLAGLFIFGGVIGKSAQFPLFTWLPDAMEGPTPVSALIHAATMVAAGVYLLIRLFPILTEDALLVIAFTGLVTSATAAVAALFQLDIKKILAYSTISQLGLMVLAIGLGAVHPALLHLFTHAFFKACLFLCAGSVIHSLQHAQARSQQHFDVQDIRNLGGLRKNLPVTFIAFVVSGASLAGIPFFSGFLSKEAIFTAIALNNTTLSWTMLSVMLGVSFLTVLYTFRMIWFIFMGQPRTMTALPAVEPPIIMRIPVIILAACSVWIIVSWNPFNFMGWLLTSDLSTHIPWLTFFSSAWIIIALVVAYLIFRKERFSRNSFIEKGYQLDDVYRATIGSVVTGSSHAVDFTDRKIIDGFIHVSAYGHVTLAHVIGWIDKTLVDGLVRFFAGFVRWIGGVARSYQTGKVQDYILYAIMALIIFLIWAL